MLGRNIISLCALGMLCAGAAQAADQSIVATQVSDAFEAATPAAEWAKLPSADLVNDAGLETNGPADISAKVTLAWNAKYFFVVVRVVDDVFRPADSMTDFWNGDSIQLGFSPKKIPTTQMTYDEKAVNGESIMFGVAELAIGTKVLPTLVPEDMPQGVWDVPTKVTRDGANLTYVLALPWAYCGGLSPLRDEPFGFNVIVNDNDLSRRAGYVKLSDGIGNGPNASEFAAATFSHAGSTPKMHMTVDRQKITIDQRAKVTVTTRDIPAGNTMRLVAGKYSVERAIPEKQPAELTFVIPAGDVPAGEARISATIASQALSQELTVKVVDPKVKANRLADARQMIPQIERMLSAEVSRGRAVDNLKIRLNMLKLADRVIGVAQRGYVTDGKTITYPKIEEGVTNYVVERAPTLLADVKAFASDSSAPQFTIPEKDLFKKWTIRDGNFYSGDQQVAIVGLHWMFMLKDWTYPLSNIGMNTNSLEIGPNHLMPEPFRINTADEMDKDGLVNNIRRTMDFAEAHNELSDPIASPHYQPSWFKEDCDFNGNNSWMDSTDGRRLLKLLYEAQGILYRDRKSVKTYDLANEWTFCSQGPSAMKDFHTWLKAKHGTIAKVNELWGTSFVSFDAIPKPYDDKTSFMPLGIYRNRAPFWDWCNFNAERAASLVQWMRDEAHKQLPDKLIHIKCILSSLSHRSLAQCFVVGTDPQQILPITDIIGLDGSYIRGAGWLDTLFSYDYMKTICPDKPIFCTESHVVPYDDPTTAGDVKRGLLQRFVHGERGYKIFLATTTEVPDWWGNSEAGYDWNMVAHPAAMEAIALTSADIQRLIEPLSRFASEPVNVRLFYDKAADFGVPGDKNNPAGQCFSQQRTVYEALLGYDVRVGMLTESMLAAGPVKEKLVVLAGVQNVNDASVNALAAYIKNNGTILWIGKNLEFDAYGKPRDAKMLEPFTKSKRVIRIDVALPAMNKAMGAYLRRAGVSTRFAAVTATGGNVTSNLELRSSTDANGKVLVFLANANRIQPQHIVLKASDGKECTWVDLITGRKFVGSTITVPTNDALLLQAQ